MGDTDPEAAPADWRALVLEAFAPLTSRGLIVAPPLDRPSPLDVVYFCAGTRRLRVGFDGVEGELLVQLSVEGHPWRDLSVFLTPELNRRLHVHRRSRAATRGMLAARLERIVGALAEAELLPGLDRGLPRTGSPRMPDGPADKGDVGGGAGPRAGTPSTEAH